MTRNQIVTAIDWGTTKVCVLVARVDMIRGPVILGVSVGPSRGASRGEVEDTEEAARALAEVIYRAEASSGVKVHDALVTLSGGYISSTNSQATIKIGQPDGRVTPGDISRVLDMVAQASSGESNRVLQVVPRSYLLDGQKSVREPSGMRCSELQLNAHLILGARWKIRSINNVLESLEIKPLGLVAAPIASAESVLSSAEKEIGVALVEIGAGVTSVVIYREGAPLHTFSIPVGGFNFTNDIAFSLGLPYQVAERVKTACGHANAGIIPRDKMIALVDLGFDDLRKVPYREVCDILRERAAEFFRLLIYKLREVDLKNQIPAGLVLTGGSANLPGLEPLGEEVLKLPVRVGTPEGMPGLPKALQVPDFAAAVGLLYWGLSHSQLSLKGEELFSLNGQHRSLHSVMERVFPWMTEVKSKSKR